MLIKYNEAFPDAAQRIVAMAERQSAHREDIEKQVIEANIRSQTRGAWFGFIIAMSAILGGTYLVVVGKSAQGLAAIITSLASLTAVFVIGKQKENKELKNKPQPLVKRSPQI